MTLFIMREVFQSSIFSNCITYLSGQRWLDRGKLWTSIKSFVCTEQIDNMIIIVSKNTFANLYSLASPNWGNISQYFCAACWPFRRSTHRWHNRALKKWSLALYFSNWLSIQDTAIYKYKHIKIHSELTHVKFYKTMLWCMCSGWCIANDFGKGVTGYYLLIFCTIFFYKTNRFSDK